VTNGKVADFRQATHNANRHTARGLGTIDKSMRTDGYGDPMLAAADGELISGSARLETVATVFGTDIEPIVVHSDGTRPVIHVRDDIPNAADKRAVRLALAANRSAELDLAWDVEVLASFDADMLDGLWTADELSDLGQQWAAEQKAAQEDPGAQIDKAEELQAKWQVKTGQLWQLGAHRLICGDCTDAAVVAQVMGSEKAGAVFYDPPYDADAKILATRWPAADVLVFSDHRHLLDCITGWGDFRCAFVWDGVTSWFTPGWPLARGKFCLWFGSGKYNPEGAFYGTPGEAHEVTNTRGTYTYKPDPRGKHLSTVFQFQNTQVEGAHAHAKPMAWVKMLIANCTNGHIFDPFAGSGTALIACEELGRRCLACEVEPINAAVIIDRWATMTGQMPLRVQNIDN
jgi:hypothetical protein